MVLLEILSKHGKLTKNFVNSAAMFKNIIIIVISVAIAFLLSITSSCNNIIVEPDVVEIAIENRSAGLKKIVTDKDSIEKIVKIINSSKKMFCIFIAPKEMTLKYKSKRDITVLISDDGHYLKIDGKSYGVHVEGENEIFWRKQP